MRSRIFCSALFAVAAAGCSGESSSGPVKAQTEYDLTVTDDRLLFREEGLVYRGSVGPFAVYHVTAANPRLVGPNVQPDKTVGYAMLCGATKYFSDYGQQGQVAVMSLHGGSRGQTELVASDQQPAASGDCAPPKDTFGNPLPDGGEAPPEDMAEPTSPPVFNPPGSGPDMTLVFNPPGNPGAGGPIVQSLQIKFDPAPDPGSTVLIRRVALTNARQHNGSHVIPSICCKGSQCTLAPIQ